MKTYNGLPLKRFNCKLKLTHVESSQFLSTTIQVDKNKNKKIKSNLIIKGFINCNLMRILTF